MELAANLFYKGFYVATNDLLVVLVPTICKSPGDRLNKKEGLTRYGNTHVKDKTS